MHLLLLQVLAALVDFQAEAGQIGLDLIDVDDFGGDARRNIGDTLVVILLVVGKHRLSELP